MHTLKRGYLFAYVAVWLATRVEGTGTLESTSSSAASSVIVVPSSQVSQALQSSSVVGSFPPAPTSTASSNASIANPASLVNLFIGTTNGGHVFPGIVQLGKIAAIVLTGFSVAF